MYFPLGWPKYLKLIPDKSSCPHFIASNCNRMLFAVLSENTLSIWYCRPSVQIVNFKLSTSKHKEVGDCCLAKWKDDASLIAVTTSKNYVLFFKVDLDRSIPNHHCLYVQHEKKLCVPKQDVNGILEADSVPAIELSLLSTLQCSSYITCLQSNQDHLIFSTVDGYLQRIPWKDRSLEYVDKINIPSISMSTDLQHCRGEMAARSNANSSRSTDRDSYVTQFDYSPFLRGYSLVLNTGKAAFAFDNRGILAKELTDAVCVAINHRYQLIAYGCYSGEGIVYSFDEMVGVLEVSHYLKVLNKDYPDAGEMIGAVSCMKWTPDETALAMCWQHGGFSLWSVFGALLVCTLGGDYWFPKSESKLYPSPVKSMEWGIEGYHLWMICKCFTEEDNSSTEDEDPSEEEEEESPSTQLLQMQFVKSSLTSNPCMANHEHLFLQGDNKLYLNIGDSVFKVSNSNVSPSVTSSPISHVLVGNKQWQVIPISHSYLSANWPIRYAAVDRSGQCIAVAGKTGLAHYALRKWKLFGNETQERDLVVFGGLTWWKDFICVACNNLVSHKDEIRCYPRSSKLDNAFACVMKVQSRVLLLNTFGDILIIFCEDSHIILYKLERKNGTAYPSVNITKVQENSLQNSIPHPLFVTGITLSSIRTESGSRLQKPLKDAESILVNLSGKLLMFQPEKASSHMKADNNKYSLDTSFCSPSVVATSVENLWTTAKANLGKLQLMEALWLGCGSQGMKVWLPLFPRDEGKTHNFMSKRIMLPFKVDIYPLAVLFEDAVILGTASETISYTFATLNRHLPSDLPYLMLDRTSQIYLHHILRQLLRRNLGVHALDLAHCCTELPYFPHVLELLLHEVLEAEATSKEPIPDPLLPRVVAFIQEFPEFLQTVVHCARKTEVALWPYLFSKVGNPTDLFEDCLASGRLQTAASYLIILQNLEKPSVSRQHATLLLDAALDKSQWDVARDLIRFLKAIDPSEVDSLPPGGVLTRMSSNPMYSSSYHSPPITTEKPAYPHVQRSASFSSSELSATETNRLNDNTKVTNNPQDSSSQTSKRRNSRSKEETTDQFCIDSILDQHARKLLSSHRLRDLGMFAANMEDFKIIRWLRKERLSAAKVEDFVMAVREVHLQFHWPFPIPPSCHYQHLKRTLAASNCNLTPSSGSPAYMDLMNGLDSESPAAATKCNSELLNLETSQPLTVDSISSAYASAEVFLKPQTNKNEDSSIATTEVLSDNSSWLAEQDVSADPITLSSDLISQELEMLSQEVANKGPPISDLELRYLLQLILEAGCLEWALIISVVLRDTLAVVRTVNTASMTDTPLEMLGRMREGLSYLELWAETECIGYKTFFLTINEQIQVLDRIANQMPAITRLSVLPVEETPVHNESKTLSPVVQTIRTDSVEKNNTEPDEDKNTKTNDCLLS
ncbi:guanine nucleotide exchange factor subunit RIC1 isoform X1 [Octopus bimaculoides]|uniref:Protein RIC1 homolog n=2 Tax=Octopus bimaculoides TaxID=37653 RepID=A0A0L8GUZ0_OCTBM|nr:guanine nucleotide exchange factor subunit RIC1 isoform X1 [Octopus bimaculoides]|eukprot:XP_014777792.1 PREDICTED: RAB6A-GEF complex partner protein 1-like isoform X1 [Octopus bimaculoides]